jgi:hypothetical protein
LLEKLSRIDIQIDRAMAEEKVEAAVYHVRSQAGNATAVTSGAEA